MTGSLIDLATTIPNLLPDQLRDAARQALELASDPYNALDDNPQISKEWLIVNILLYDMARQLEQRLIILFHEGTVPHDE